MSSKIKVDTIENVAGSGNVSLGSGHNLVVPGNNSTTGNATVGGTLGVTGTLTSNGISNLIGSATHGTDAGDTRFIFTGPNQYRAVFKQGGNIAGQLGGGGTDDLRFSNAAGAITMQIKGGHISAPLQPAFVARKSGGNQSVGAVTTQITGFTTILDVGTNWDNSQNRYTVPTAGIYLAGGFYQANQSTGLHFGIYKNGASYGNDSYLDAVAAAANGYSVPFSMAANDYFTWIAYCSTSSTINQNRSKIWVIKVA